MEMNLRRLEFSFGHLVDVHGQESGFEGWFQSLTFCFQGVWSSYWICGDTLVPRTWGRLLVFLLNDFVYLSMHSSCVDHSESPDVQGDVAAEAVFNRSGHLVCWIPRFFFPARICWFLRLLEVGCILGEILGRKAREPRDLTELTWSASHACCLNIHSLTSIDLVEFAVQQAVVKPQAMFPGKNHIDMDWALTFGLKISGTQIFGKSFFFTGGWGMYGGQGAWKSCWFWSQLASEGEILSCEQRNCWKVATCKVLENLTKWQDTDAYRFLRKVSCLWVFQDFFRCFQCASSWWMTRIQPGRFVLKVLVPTWVRPEFFRPNFFHLWSTVTFFF